ncbi:8-amino-7-oxononanoate synthase [Vibrio aquaticus]|uniref:8-amino-7-oxononanoate synthase n=1 Tax=Vibrio aquaticus TaxID=2496559 RepID=A0A432CVB4_9VIBR|nr:8-amino-7-oxononanoate synthase [Vibrio aquaticus]RTZ15650.1 8-amino-7-oxononanoate synthase [Vibrio aquaticus]
MLAFDLRVNNALAAREQQGLTRHIRTVSGGNTHTLHHGHDAFINFSSNDYLGLASDKSLANAWQTGIDNYGNGSGASPLVTGFSGAHQQLEETLCEWLGFERAILFSSGFSANQALLFSLLNKEDLLLQDKLNHASLMEAGMLSPATMKRFKHNNVEHLNSLLTKDALVVTEGVFSMDGDRAPLANIHQTTHGKAWLAVDDAHGIGVLGNQGRGSCEAANIKPELLVVTFGKAFGLSGAAIMCSESVGDYLTQFARHHVYSTAIPPSQAFALTHAAKMIQTEQWRRDKLHELNERYHQHLAGIEGYVETTTPIKPFIIGEDQQALDVAENLKRSGLWVTAIRPPTVPKGTARLRITLTANHELRHIDTLSEHLKVALKG